ncbi:hypothetical protein OEZ86_000329 [Tetradesmus obliquus]|nr:hypothetical protein OEZ86_000329 [Tetradesmus obliquus]
MASRGKEAAVVVLDVGPHMASYLPALRKSVFLLAESKLLNHSSHELAVVLFGTTGTANEVYDEMGPEEGEQYRHISVVQPLACPDLKCLKTINSISSERGSSDHVSALLVGVDLLKKAVAARPSAFKGHKRLLLISSFDTQVEELDPETCTDVAAQLTQAGLSLEVYGVGDGAPARSEAAAAQRASNLAGLHELLAQVAGSYRALPSEVSMAAIFTLKETASTGYKASLAIGTKCRIEVQVYKKTAKQPLPSLKLYSPPTAAGGSGLVTRETEYRDPTDRDHVLAAEEKQKGYKYGQQLVPVEDDALLAYKPEPCLELLGFTARENVPRWHYSAECYVALGVTAPDALALSALVRGLAKQDKVAVLRYLGTSRGSSIMLMAGSPQVAPDASLLQQDCLLLNRLPFADDMRQLLFKDFTQYKADPNKQHLYPSTDGMKAMRQLVKNLSLAPAATAAAGATQQTQTQATQQGSSQQPAAAAAAAAAGPVREQLVPEDTLNPMLQRFYWFIGQRALDPQFQVPDAKDDVLAAAVLDQAPAGSLPAGTEQLLAALPKHFPITERVPAAPTAEAGADAAAGTSAAAAAAGGAAMAPAAAAAVVADESGVRLVSEVTDDAPLESFAALLQHGQIDNAFTGMQRVVRQLVEASIGPRQFPRAVQAVTALRQAAVQQGRPAAFNAYLDQLRDAFKPNPAKRAFWQQLMQQQLGPISDDEAPGAGVSRAAAEQYVQLHGAAQQAAPEPAKPAPMAVDEEDDEFAGMD